MLMLLIAGLIICAAVSTPATRAAGRKAAKPFVRFCGIATVLLWAAILIPELFRH